jgi:hypothetical protein
VPAALHRERFGRQTHLPALEPVARNAAARRTNPANRWLLSTNTDMIVLPRAGESLSDVCRDLPDAYYGLPRFEVPEWLWEGLPRSDPGRAMSELEYLGPRLRLDETTLNHEWVRFDAPGDFQLCLRDDIFAIDGFDEEMLLGWHVDSNLSRRMFLRHGAVESLEDRVAGYHCNHSRTPTVYGPDAVGNDLVRFFTSVQRAELPAQRETWGLADATLKEIPVRGRVGRRFADVLVTAIPPDGVRLTPNVLDTHMSLTYDSSHVFPFVADSIAVSPPLTTVGYLGANPALQTMLSQLVSEVDVGLTLNVIAADNEGATDEFTDSIDLLVVDLGLDIGVLPEISDQFDSDVGAIRFPATLRSVVEAFERLVHRERARLESGHHPRRFVLINSSTGYLNPFVVSQLDCSHTTMHSRVRRATVKSVPTSRVSATRDVSFGDRLDPPREPLRLRVGERIEVADLPDFRGFGRGWRFPDPTAIWTSGARAELRLACDDAQDDRLIFEISLVRVGVRSDCSLDVDLVIAGNRIATRSFPGGTDATTWRAGIPTPAIARPTFDVALEMDAHGAWADDRQLGLHVRSLGIERGGLQRLPRDVAAKTHRAVSRLIRSRVRIEST